MQLGMIGLGRMGGNMVRRLLHARTRVRGLRRRSPPPSATLAGEGATGADSLADLRGALRPPRAIWLMVPAARRRSGARGSGSAARRRATSSSTAATRYYHDDIRRARGARAEQASTTSMSAPAAASWGLERGYCLMIGGEDDVVARLDPIFAALAPGIDAAPRTPGREQRSGTAEQGYLHCGPHGAGHFVKMVHNGIEYGLMAAYAEGLNILRHADVGQRSARGRRRDHAAAPIRSTTSTI